MSVGFCVPVFHCTRSDYYVLTSLFSSFFSRLTALELMAHTVFTLSLSVCVDCCGVWCVVCGDVCLVSDGCDDVVSIVDDDILCTI
jgi:hypothetical protein